MLTTLLGRPISEINTCLFTTNDFLIDANGEFGSQIIAFWESKPIRYIHIYFSTVGNTGDVMVSLKSINDGSLPSYPDAILGSGNSAYGTASISTSGWYRIQLSSDYTPAMGEECFFVAGNTNFQSGDSLTVGSASVRQTVSNLYRNTYLGSTYSAGNQLIAFALESTDGTFLNYSIKNPCYITSLSVDTSTTPDEIGNVCTAQRDHTVIGVEFVGDVDGAVDVKFYGLSTLTASVVVNRRINANVGITRKYFSSAYNATAGESYRVSVLPTSTTTGTYRDYTYPTGYEAAVKANLFGSDVIINKTTRKSGGTWTDDATKVCGVMPVISNINIPLLIQPDMAGGMNG